VGDAVAALIRGPRAPLKLALAGVLPVYQAVRPSLDGSDDDDHKKRWNGYNLEHYFLLIYSVIQLNIERSGTSRGNENDVELTLHKALQETALDFN
jgi:hypothetical protein